MHPREFGIGIGGAQPGHSPVCSRMPLRKVPLATFVETIFQLPRRPRTARFTGYGPNSLALAVRGLGVLTQLVGLGSVGGSWVSVGLGL
jgi:hypothetical protein